MSTAEGATVEAGSQQDPVATTGGGAAAEVHCAVPVVLRTPCVAPGHTADVEGSAPGLELRRGEKHMCGGGLPWAGKHNVSGKNTWAGVRRCNGSRPVLQGAARGSVCVSICASCAVGSRARWTHVPDCVKYARLCLDQHKNPGFSEAVWHERAVVLSVQPKQWRLRGIRRGQPLWSWATGRSVTGRSSCSSMPQTGSFATDQSRPIGDDTCETRVSVVVAHLALTPKPAFHGHGSFVTSCSQLHISI